MAFIQCDFYSKALGVATSMNVILPENIDSDQPDYSLTNNTKYPTLYLLHGLTGDHTAWMRKSSIDRYVRELKLAVVMPAAGRSFYTDMEHGYDYFTFITEELPYVAESFFPLSSRREDRFIAGLSMGGYGALKAALSKPESYYAAASLSGAVDIKSVTNSLIEQGQVNNLKEFNNIFGDLDDFCGGPNDLYSLASKCSTSKLKPNIYMSCGTEDFLYQDNLCFKKHLDSLSFDFTYMEGPGDHDWHFWDKEIQSVLKWLEV
ncbi:MAG: esterase family protein [Epulopiscium sp.]|nr:esterase family protein [Candidatus Epulonipiscium sp.]